MFVTFLCFFHTKQQQQKPWPAKEPQRIVKLPDLAVRSPLSLPRGDTDGERHCYSGKSVAAHYC